MSDESVQRSQAFRAAYSAETVPILRQRLTVAMGIFVFFMGIGTVVEVSNYPSRRSFALLVYGIEAATAILGPAMCWIARLRRWSAYIAAGVLITITSCISAYHASVGATAERVATVLGCVLNLLSVLLPWGWVVQLIASLGSVVGFAVALPRLVTSDAPAIPMTVLVATATTSVVAAFFLDRYRFEAFRRTALQTEEAEIAAGLAHVAETLSQHLGQPNVLEEVNLLATEALGCDWSSLFLFDKRRGAYRLCSNVGSPPQVQSDLAAIEFPPDSLPLLQALKPGELIEIADVANQTLVPLDFMRRMAVSSALYAPVSRGDQIIGVLANGCCERVGPFTNRQRRLTLGIAHATAIAVENGRLIADLQGANRLKSEFVATMSHELRTPLNVIMGYTEMLADGTFDPRDAEWSDALARIQTHSVELLDLVNATLDMGRLEAGYASVTWTPLHLTRLFADLARELAPLAREGVQLSWRNDVGAAPILTDAPKLKTVLKNLIGNALKFTSAGSVAVAAERDDGVLRFTVKDSGIGIAAEHLPLIFEMFRQVDSSLTRQYGGVGLGLHIAQRLVVLLGGTIAVTSTPGVGSTFTVELPIRTSEAGRSVDEIATAP